MAQFMKEKVVEVVEIDEIVRQKDAGLLAVAQAFADGRNEEAVQLAAPYMTTVTVTDDDYKAAEASKSDAKPVNGPMPDATRNMLNLVKTIRKSIKTSPRHRHTILKPFGNGLTPIQRRNSVLRLRYSPRKTSAFKLSPGRRRKRISNCRKMSAPKR